ncbi:MAG: hypothetical protein JJU27_00185 [Gammaproteobacteria bacterium]|nr:hypothetical protein [Gammaproteobacteria bacterium]
MICDQALEQFREAVHVIHGVTAVNTRQPRVASTGMKRVPKVLSLCADMHFATGTFMPPDETPPLAAAN